MKILLFVSLFVGLVAAQTPTLPVPPPRPPVQQTTPPPPIPPPVSVPSGPIAPLPQQFPPPPGSASLTTEVYLLAALRAQDVKIADLEARIAKLEKGRAK